MVAAEAVEEAQVDHCSYRATPSSSVVKQIDESETPKIEDCEKTPNSVTAASSKGGYFVDHYGYPTCSIGNDRRR